MLGYGKLEIAIDAIKHVGEPDALDAFDVAHIRYLKFFGTTGMGFLGNDENLALVSQRQRDDFGIRPYVITGVVLESWMMCTRDTLNMPLSNSI